MLKENEKIVLSGQEALNVLPEIEYILISLINIARYYHNGSGIEDETRYFKETTKFIDENKITYRLANIRKIISEKFNGNLGEDDTDDIE